MPRQILPENDGQGENFPFLHQHSMDAGNDELFEKYLNPKNVHCLRYERSLRGEYESKDL